MILLFSGEKTTLRSLEAQFESQQFQKFSLQRKKYTTINRTAFHYRFEKLPPKFFREEQRFRNFFKRLFPLQIII